MSKSNLKYDYLLPKLQKRIMLCLAKNGAMTMSETNRKLSGENTSTTRAFHELEKKSMIEVKEHIAYRGRKFSKYWLSGRGIGFVLLNGANPEKTKNIALSFENDKTDKTTAEFFELRGLSPKIANILDNALVLTPTLSKGEMFGHLFAGISSLNADEKKRFFEVVRKSGEFTDTVQQVKENMKEFMEGLEEK